MSNQYTEEQKNKIRLAEKELDNDYLKFVNSCTAFFEKHSKVICGVKTRCFRGGWNLQLEFDNEEIRNQAIKE